MATDPDLERKKGFLTAFKTKKVVGPTLLFSGVKRREFNEWFKTDQDFRRVFEDLEAQIDDEVLEIVYVECGLLRRKGKRKAIDRTLLRDVLRRHPKFRGEAREEAPIAVPAQIKGVDPKTIINILGGQVVISDKGLELPKAQEQQAIEGAAPEPEAPPHKPYYSPEQIAEFKKAKGGGRQQQVEGSA